jgi:hypothetical protein
MATKKAPKIKAKTTKVYKVYYTKKVGGVGSVMVKASSPADALANAKQHVFTGKEFRNPKLQPAGSAAPKPRRQGYQGSGRIS